jgi:photosystem II stability/assembly factor-like uncharacterized protein
MEVRRLVPVALLLLAAGSAAHAASPEMPDLSGALHWRLIGPFRAGRVLAVSGVPGEPDHFYFGSVNGGVWESRNAGRTWQPIFDGQPIGSIGALAVAPSDPRVLYAGTGEADMRSAIAQGDGVYRSRDGGATWTHVGLADSQQIGRILIAPDDPETVFVAALGHPYGPNEERGVFRSRDGGEHWQRVLGEGADTGAIDLAFEPGDPRVIYAALWQTRRTPWSVYPPSSGPGSGLFKSTDGGDTWSAIGGNGFPQRPGRIGVAVAPSAPQRVYAIVDADAGGLYRSDDGGGHWRLASADERIWGRGWYFGAVTVDPEDPDVVYVPNVNLYRSDDGGATFAPVKGAPGGDDYHQLWIDPAHPERRMLGVDQGATVSVDGGATWSSWYNQPTGQFYHVITDDRFPYRVYGAQQDSGAAAVPSRTSSYDGINITRFRETTAGGESDNIAPDPLDPEVIFGGRVERLDLRTEQTRSVPPPLAYPDLYRRTWTLPLIFSRRDPRVLYFAHQQVFRTADGGEHWEVISPDLTRPDPGVPANLDPVTAALTTGPRPGVVYALAPSRFADGELWAGTDDGLIWRTRDEGAHWQDVTPAGLTPWSKVGTLETSHFDADTAYAAVDRHRLDDFRPYVYRTHDGGAHWQLAAAGIPDGSFVNGVREDPVRRGLLYAGTEKGVYVSSDDGDHWESLQLDLPVTSVRDLDVHGDDLVIATHGRAFWILDDVTPLRQLDEVPAGAAAWLFRPAPAVRLRPAGFTGTPMPRDEPLAANPPAGAYLDYFLRADASAAVTLEIRDEAGGLVRSYSSAVAPPAPDPALLRTAPEWFRVPVTLSTEAGLHRFVWPLRTAAPPALARGNAYADGVWVPPGRYLVALTVDGRRFEQPLAVVPDPRVTVSPEGYAEQFALALRVETQRDAIAAAAREAERLTKALVARRPGAEGKVRAAMDALLGRVLGLWGLPLSSNPGNSWWMPPQSVATLRFLGGALDELAGAVDGADAPPSPDARAGAAKLAPMVEAAAAAWQALKAGDLASLNARLEAAKQPPIRLAPGPG